MYERSLAIAMFALVTICAAPVQASEPTTNVIPRSELKFVPLNPLRGDASPKAGMLWGDIRKDVPTGVLLKFAPGFSSPPHIHNITYRAVVISGELHNDDPEAAKFWMGPGSFWVQPAGENHITAGSKDDGATAFLEILEGPYLVQPAAKAFDNGERPINVEARNIIWLNASDLKWVGLENSNGNEASPEMAFLWGKPVAGEKNATFLRLPTGFEGTITGNGAILRTVVITGNVSHGSGGDTAPQELEPGSYFGSQGGATHRIKCNAEDGCLLYVRTEGRYTLSRG